ncbi:hypothetical protein SK128_014991 [Halocaridina rubra]|uniref:Ig-like domain-containing protein n=1 Tax=Halocaridina rubra TaxID=373956 RepID=A0AAN8XFU3_HALRR
MPVSDTGIVAEGKDFSSDDGSSLRVRVIGRRWVRLPEGSTLRLVCEAAGKDLQEVNRHALLHNDPLISWTLDGIPITSLWPHSKVLVRESWSGTTVESEVEVTSLQIGDGGTFACTVPRVPPDVVTVSVVESHYTESQAKVVSFEADDSFESFQAEEDSHDVGVAGAAGKAAVISGAIILVLLLIQAALCAFYIKKV